MESYYDRQQRLVSVFEDTQRRIAESSELQAAQLYSIEHQQLILESEEYASPLPAYESEAQVLVTRNRSFEAAAHHLGQRVCVLNFASAANPGGGVQHGASAQEECLCRCSTLYNCLNTRAMWDGFYYPHRQSANPLHNDDIIFTPGVQVLKDDDYNMLSQPFAVDVITCAAPNLRDEPSNKYNTGDGNRCATLSDDALLALHELRARRIMAVAAQNKAEVLILGAFGCGAFCNDPKVVAQAYKNVLPEFIHHFLTIEFAVYCRPYDDTNYRTFNHVINS